MIMMKAGNNWGIKGLATFDSRGVHKEISRQLLEMDP